MTIFIWSLFLAVELCLPLCFAGKPPSAAKPVRQGPPLDETLAFYKLDGSNGQSEKLTHSFVAVSCGANLSVHHTDPSVFPDGGSAERPILTLNHGYPESSYIWRRITGPLSKRLPLIVADRPGYGLSTSCTTGTDERTNAGALLDAIASIYGSGKTIVLGGHDRGARAMHRAAVDIGQGRFPQVKALGVFMADIVPIVEEYASFTDPKHAVGYFHWSFLPRLQEDFSTNIIMAYGGGNFVDFLNRAGAGINETAIESFYADDALAVYHTFFDQYSVINASNYDYYSGSTTDFVDMQADQAAGRKIKMPVHIQYSSYNLEQLGGFDVRETWSNYIEPGTPFTTGPVCCGQGHFIVELAPQETIDQLNEFLDTLGVKEAVVMQGRDEL